MSYPIVVGQIVRTAGNSNAMLSTGNKQYNIGPLPESAVGESVLAVPLNNNWAACLNPHIDIDQYIFRLAYSSGIYDLRIRRAINAVQNRQNGVRNFQQHANFSPAPADSQPIDQLAEDKSTTTENRDPMDSVNELSLETATAPKQPPITDQEATEIPPATPELRALRARAEAVASNDPVRDTSQTGGGSKYQRAQPIKNYVKLRADGVCEACNKSAPFLNQSGEPYLEAHHVDELGEGGEDHPSKVVALCPTCHKQIHHGERGQQINEALREKLSNGLADVGAE